MATLLASLSAVADPAGLGGLAGATLDGWSPVATLLVTSLGCCGSQEAVVPFC